MRQILEAGHVQTTMLKPRVTNGKALWQAWHHDFAVSRALCEVIVVQPGRSISHSATHGWLTHQVNQQPAFEADDVAVRDEAALMDHDFDVVDVSSETSSLQVRLF